MKERGVRGDENPHSMTKPHLFIARQRSVVDVFDRGLHRGVSVSEVIQLQYSFLREGRRTGIGSGLG